MTVKPEDVQRLLALPLPDNISGAPTVRGYLAELLLKVWREEGNFNGKRPFGNSGWQDDIYREMVRARLVWGKLDEDGCLEDCDDDSAQEMVMAAITAMGETAGSPS